MGAGPAETEGANIYFLAILLFLFGTANASSGVLGVWVTPNNSLVRIERCGSALCARLVQVAPTTPEKTDKNNPDPKLRQRSLCGLQIGSHFQSVDPTHAKDGQLYDPMSGKTYSGTMVAEGDSLKLRGYIGISLFGRTEVWHRSSKAVDPCKS